MFYIYIIYSGKTDRYYVGTCKDVSLRIQQHNAGRNLSTKAGIPWCLKCTEQYGTHAEACRRELQIKKKKSRKYIEWLILLRQE